MKKILLATLLFVCLNPLTASAGMLGLDWSATGEYNLDTDASSLTMEVGRSMDLGGITLTADADFDIMASSFGGTDYKASMAMPGSSGLEFYLSTGLSSDWAREDVVAGFSLSW